MRLQNVVKSIVNIGIIFALVLLGSSILVSCVSLKSHLQLTHRTSKMAPIDAFAFVSVTQMAIPGECLPSPREEDCREMLSDLPPMMQSGSGSGLLVWAKKRPVFLTAAHVCTSEIPDVYDSHGIKFTIEKEVMITVRGVTGEVLKTKILKINEEKDLCALDVPKMTSAPVRVSHREPRVGDEVYAVSAPFGINTPTLNLFFSGYYSGKDKRWHYYTIPTRPGSSGSIVLNKNFRAIGMLNAAFLDIEHVGLGAGHEDLVKFLEDIE